MTFRRGGDDIKRAGDLGREEVMIVPNGANRLVKVLDGPLIEEHDDADGISSRNVDLLVILVGSHHGRNVYSSLNNSIA
jgi:hypothetical protein